MKPLHYDAVCSILSLWICKITCTVAEVINWGCLVQVLRLDTQMQKLAEELKHENSLLVFGRGYNYATALEAALKVRLLQAAYQHVCKHTA